MTQEPRFDPDGTPVPPSVAAARVAEAKTRTVAFLDTPAMVNKFKDEIEDLAAQGWDQDERGHFDWEGFADRFEKHYPMVDLGSDMSTPAFRRFQSIARAAAREARGDA